MQNFAAGMLTDSTKCGQNSPVLNKLGWFTIDQFWYIKIQPKTIDLSTRLMGITTEFLGFIPKSLVLKFIVLGWILIYRNWPIKHALKLRDVTMIYKWLKSLSPLFFSILEEK